MNFPSEPIVAAQESVETPAKQFQFFTSPNLQQYISCPSFEQPQSLLLHSVMNDISGTFLSMSWVTFFMKNMVNGRGYIGLSAQNMANGDPLGSALASILFGATDSLATTLKSQTNFPTEFLEMIPYLATIIAIIISSIIVIHRKKNIEKL